MVERASIVGAAETSVGKVRDHNEDAHFIDPEAGIFIVCDGMGGHAAGEVASALAVQTIRARWASRALHAAIDRWLQLGTPEARKQMMSQLQQGVIDAHDAIVSEADRDRGKSGMGTTLVGAMVVGADVVFAHCGDSRAYLVRDGIAMQLTEDHTLLARLLAAGVEVDVEGDGMRFKSMLTNALGIGHECKVSTFVVPVADGDRFLLCSDGITEYVLEHEVGEVLSQSPSPARAAQRLVEMALARGGGDNATALVVRVLEAGEAPRPSEHLRREEQAIHACPLWAKVNPQQRLRALRIALPRDYAINEKVPAQTLGDRVAWILVEGEVEQDNLLRGPGSLLYPEALLTDRPLPDKDGLAVAQSEVRVLALRSDDFRELCDDDPELGEALLAALANEIAIRRPHRRTGKIVIGGDGNAREGTDPGTDETMPEGPAHKRTRSTTNPGVPVAPAMERVPRAPTIPPPIRMVEPPAPEEHTPPPPEPPPLAAPPDPPARLSQPRLHARGSSPPSSLIASKGDVEVDLDRALTDLTAEAPKQLEPAQDEDAEIVVEPVTKNKLPRRAKPPTPVGLSEPEISIEELEDQVAEEDGVVEAADGAHDTSDVHEVIEALDNEDKEPEISAVAEGGVVEAADGAHDTSDVHEIIEALDNEDKEPEIIAEPAAENGTHDRAVVQEVLKDTSSQTITLSRTESDPDIVVEPIVAADSGPHHPRPKRQTDTHE